ILPMASISAGVGPFIGCGEVMMYMKRMKYSCVLRAEGVGPQFRLATGNDDPAGAGSTRPAKKNQPSAADLKSLTHSRQNRIQGVQIESGTRIKDLLVPLAFRSPRKSIAAT